MAFILLLALNPTSCPMDTVNFHPGGKAAGPWSWPLPST